ncbi:MAG: MAPEG family protein [Paracoccaceae bacterium]
MEFPIIAATTAGILLVMQQALMLNVGMHRTKLKMGTGFGEDLDMERLSRRHGNLAENAGIFIVTLALLELYVGSGTAVSGFAATFVAARVSHIIGFSSLAGSHLKEGSKLFLVLRAGGATLTALVGLVTGMYLFYQVALAL